MSATDLPLVVLPDAVELVTSFLRGQAEVAALVGDRVYSILPAHRTFPLLLAAQVGDLPVINRPYWATRADFQLQAYAGHANEAKAALETAKGVLAARGIAAHPQGTIAWVSFANTAYLPDGSLHNSAGRPMPRWVTTLTVTVHPNP